MISSLVAMLKPSDRHDVVHSGGISVNALLWHLTNMAQDDLYFRLRIPADLKDRIKAAAVDNHRSITAEIISLLERSFPDLSHKGTSKDGGANLIAEILADVDQLKAKLQGLRAIGEDDQG
ncbi:Arc family DNA-binding protein [Rhizobium leguminosarum]|uniref:Arc family DNA-binding protein n=1 Tax=Rhizobium leguminosarum TaxID=384 RepID=UPI003F9B3B2B